jgi:hypothetical protein
MFVYLKFYLYLCLYMTGVKSKPRPEIVEGNYYLTLQQIRECYYPKHISIGELNLQTVGTTITIDHDTITIMADPIEKYKVPSK